MHQPNKKQAEKNPKRLDLVFMPLVAFDKNSNRLGMGGGFYDRCFAFRNTTQQDNIRTRPLLIGCAHALQEMSSLKPEKWDVPLDGILTEKYFLRF